VANQNLAIGRFNQVIKPKRILHIAEDSIFISSFSELMEEINPGENQYLIKLSPSGKLVHSYGAQNIQTYKTDIQGYINFLTRRNKFDVIIVHYMNLLGSLAFLSTERTPVKIWSGFGADYLNLNNKIPTKYLGPLTRMVFPNFTSKKKFEIRNSHIKFMKSFLMQRAAGKATHFSAPIPSDFNEFSTNFPKFAGDFMQLNYATAEKSASENKALRSDILLGNSSSPTNNHRDLLHWLVTHEIGDRKILCPLSYGDIGDYSQNIIEEGQILFGKSFIPITNYMDISDYQKTIANCEFIIMGHIRQQGLGNILSGLMSGKTVILDGKSAIYNYLCSLGVTVFSLENSSSTEMPMLSENQREKNVQLISQQWGKAAVLRNLSQILSLNILRRQDETPFR